MGTHTKQRIYGAYKAVAAAIAAGCQTTPQIREQTGLATHQVQHAIQLLRDRGWAQSIGQAKGNKYRPASYVLCVPLSEIILDEPVPLSAEPLWRTLGMPVAVPVPYLAQARARVHRIGRGEVDVDASE